MDVQQLLEAAHDTLMVKRVFGEPYERNGLMVIPVARVQAGGGGGHGNGPDGSAGEGGGYGLSARPAGVYVVAGDKVRWAPAVDINRIVVGAQVLAAVALLAVRGIVRARATPPQDAPVVQANLLTLRSILRARGRKA
jgi:uncharacterized spore protein YtfJ